MSEAQGSATGRVRQLYVHDVGETSPRRSDRPITNTAHATIGADIRCDQSMFDSYSYEGWHAVHYDLLIVCAAVEFADRRWARSRVQWARHIHVTIPVHEIATWQDGDVQHNLRNTLRHLTGDEWDFTFTRSDGDAMTKSRPRHLFPLQHKELVIAYSDGLDSLCVSGLYNDNDEAVRVRVSKHKRTNRPDDQPFDRLPFNVHVRPSKEDSVRSRGFKFAAVTAIAAHISGVSRVVVPESGQGALGPVLLPLRGVYPDYRSHPTFFRRMEKFVRALLGVGISYEQPRLWFTKGQTVAAFLKKHDMDARRVINTRSCWQFRANVRVRGSLRQCGICAACLLRRMSLHAAGVEEPAGTYSVTNLAAEHFANALPADPNFGPTATLKDYGHMGARHLQQLARLAAEPDAALGPHVYELAEAVGASKSDVQTHLRDMLLCHADEWTAFATVHGRQSFLHRWTTGGRHG